MSTVSKFMLLAILVLVSSAAFAAVPPTVIATPSSQHADGVSTIVISISGGVANDTTPGYTISAPLGVTVTGGPIQTNATGGGTSTVTLKSSALGVYTITANDGAGSVGTTTVVFNKDQLEVDITVSLSIAINVTFTDTNSSETWTLSNSSLDTTYDTTTSSVVTDIKNNTGAQVDVTVAVVNPPAWVASVDNSSAPNQYVITTVPVTTTLTLAGGPQAYETIAPGGNTTTNKLTLQTPKTVTHVSPGGQIKVKYAATLTP